MVEFSSQVLRKFMMTINDKNERNDLLLPVGLLLPKAQPANADVFPAVTGSTENNVCPVICHVIDTQLCVFECPITGIQ